jgi:adenylate cyclase
MFELIAQGTKPEQRWRRELPNQTPVEIGRQARWSVPWDNKISRRHLTAELRNGLLVVRRLADTANPVFFKGKDVPAFGIRPGEHFVVGDTTFSLMNERAFVTQDVPNPVSQRTFSHEFLQQVQYRDADRRIDVLNRLPEVIAGTGSEKELMIRLVNILLHGISSASAVAMVRKGKRENDIEILHWDRQLTSQGDFQPSEGLIRQSIDGGETVLHVWNQRSSSDAGSPQFTFDYENDWAFVCPLSGSACRGWGIYVAGKNRADEPTGSGSGASDVQGDIKFTELVGSTVANVLQIQNLERRQTSLRTFFSPLVLDAFADQDPDSVLAPRQCEVSVLFCDLRGFSRTSEEMAGELIELLSRVSSALGIMTRIVMKLDGVVGDFHGDAAMGFWGWPFPQQNTAASACRAAIQIQSELAMLARQREPLRGFQMGIGIATGTAVAGKIGTSDQVKVTVFGPVPNLAARLESMTRLFGSHVLLDKATANKVVGCDDISCQLLMRVQPYGLQTATEVYRLLFPNSCFDDQHLAEYSAALTDFEAGNWSAAARIFAELRKTDSVAGFLNDYIQSFSATPPADWKGTIELKTK